MPRLDRMGLQDDVVEKLASLAVPITLAESLLTREPEHVARESALSIGDVMRLRYHVSLQCQSQPPVLDRRPRRDEDDDGDADGNASSNRRTDERGAAGGDGHRAADRLRAVGSRGDELYRQAREVGGFVTTGADSLDDLLNKGLMLHHVIELVGRSAVGKTQLCLTAAVAAASHGIGVLYIDTANGCNVRRMQQIARSRYADHNGEMTARQMDALLDRLRVVRAFDITTVISALIAYMDGVTEGGPDGVYSECRLVIVDSVTAVVSPLLGGVKHPHGHGLMATLGHLLSRTAKQCSACVLVANSTVGSREAAENDVPRAALGTAWDFVASIRLLLADRPVSGGDSGGGGQRGNRAAMRSATLLRHPAQAITGENTAAFAIGDAGVTDIQGR